MCEEKARSEGGVAFNGLSGPWLACVCVDSGYQAIGLIFSWRPGVEVYSHALLLSRSVD